MVYKITLAKASPIGTNFMRKDYSASLSEALFWDREKPIIITEIIIDTIPSQCLLLSTSLYRILNTTAEVNEVRIVRDMHTDGEIPAFLAKCEIKPILAFAKVKINALSAT